MCLYVRYKPGSRKESILVKCRKKLSMYGHVYRTPYMWTRVNKNGILKEKEVYFKNYHLGDKIEGSHIHAYKINESITATYPAYAINVKAYGYYDLVCKLLYIPAADFSNKKDEKVAALEKILKKGDSMNWKDILKIFPRYVDCFKANEYYNIDVPEKGQIMNQNDNTFKVNWSKMIKEENVSMDDLRRFAFGLMPRRQFESLSTTARQAVRRLGANETRKRARKVVN
jgi:hypothetical protein